MCEGLWGGCLEDRHCLREAFGGVALHTGQLWGQMMEAVMLLSLHIPIKRMIFDGGGKAHFCHHFFFFLQVYSL